MGSAAAQSFSVLRDCGWFSQKIDRSMRSDLSHIDDQLAEHGEAHRSSQSVRTDPSGFSYQN
jgi:hypothetical protein